MVSGGSRGVPRAVSPWLVVLALVVAACSPSAVSVPLSPSRRAPAPNPVMADRLPGMPRVADPHDVYADAGANMVAPVVAADRPLVYVPLNTGSVWVIDPKTFAVVGKYPGGREYQHVVPSWDMRALYATDDLANRLVPFDPRTGRPGTAIPVLDPYNLYFSPDGRYGISVAEDHRELVWYDAHRWRQAAVTPIPGCAGIDHADFSVNGRIAVLTCEFAGRVAVVDVASHTLLRTIDMPRRDTHMGPQDIKMAPDGSVYYIADSDAGGLWVLDGAASHVERFIRTGKGAHGLYLSRDGRRLFVTNRMEGSVSVLDAYTGAVRATWWLPGGGSPDMGNLTADGRELWLSGRYNSVVYVLATNTGALLHTIRVGNGPHGLCVWPQPGRYSLGHTGITR